MQWNMIFDNESVKWEFEKLTGRQKKFLIACYLYRHIRLVRNFDEVYSKNLKDFFLDALEVAAFGAKKSILDLKPELEVNIPDTEYFCEQEGSYAQNIMVSLDYYLSFCIDLNLSSLGSCVEMALQNIDLLNYEVDENYNEKEVIKEESEIMRRLIEGVSKLDASSSFRIDGLLDIANDYML